MSPKPTVRKGPVGAGAPPSAPEPAVPSFAIVGIGASAGGLEAFTELLRHLPPDTGMAFVLVQHLDPTHESMLPELLSSKTAMTVIEATDDLPVAPNTVYVTPAAQDVTIEQGVLKLKSPSDLRPPPSRRFVPRFSRPRPQDRCGGRGPLRHGRRRRGRRAGRESEQAARPWRRTQAPPSTRACPRTRSPPARSISSFLSRCSHDNYRSSLDTRSLCRSARRPARSALSAEDPILADLLTLVRSATKADFSHYKQSTVMRRISRRMAMQHVRGSRGVIWSYSATTRPRSRLSTRISSSASPVSSGSLRCSRRSRRRSSPR